VVGVPDAIEGESVWAFVLLEDGTEMTVREVLDHCRQELELYKIPSRVQFPVELPRSATGKPKKFKLREMALDHTKGEQP
jgi:acyl-CoA synthetase (AMP-forming)/AMP-acid ligase II